MNLFDASQVEGSVAGQMMPDGRGECCAHSGRAAFVGERGPASARLPSHSLRQSSAGGHGARLYVPSVRSPLGLLKPSQQKTPRRGGGALLGLLQGGEICISIYVWIRGR